MMPEHFKIRSQTGDLFARNPMLVYWETTRACALACRHCRASAMPCADPEELTHEEGLKLIDQIAEFGRPLPHLILTGGDPLDRQRLDEIVKYARSKDIRVSITPAATPKLSFQTFKDLKDAGIQGIGLSLDGATAESHDAIRQVPGCFDITIQAAKWGGELELPLQVNTLVCKETADELPEVYKLLHEFPVERWSLFFLISVGRGKQLNEMDPADGEELMRWVYDLSRTAPFQIKTTEAPSYRRVYQDKMLEAGMTVEQIRQSSVWRGYGIRDGNGIVFISHIGEVYPSGFLPLHSGNVRSQPLADIYRNSDVFRKVRDVDNFSGKCGVCEYRAICGGSRARAYAYTGDPAGSDPFCPYYPQRPGELIELS